jgi:hypothetical protein
MTRRETTGITRVIREESTMKTIRIGAEGAEVSQLGLGCQLGGGICERRFEGVGRIAGHMARIVDVFPLLSAVLEH